MRDKLSPFWVLLFDLFYPGFLKLNNPPTLASWVLGLGVHTSATSRFIFLIFWQLLHRFVDLSFAGLSVVPTMEGTALSLHEGIGQAADTVV